MMVLATALLAGSLLATGAQARGGGGGGGGGHMAGGSRMADMGRDHYGRRGYGGYYDYGSCPYYTSYNWPYTCTY